MAEKRCSECGGQAFRVVNDEWMKRTFRFVENGTLEMCDGCGAKFLVCEQCGEEPHKKYSPLRSELKQCKCGEFKI